MSTVCGTGSGTTQPLPGDPDNVVVLSATSAFGGIDVSWTPPETNPHAVAHTLLYRSTSGTEGTQILHETVGGNFFYDKTIGTSDIEYFYWIRIVSINGTVGDSIGPVSAVARPTIEDTLIGLTGRIDEGVLAQALKSEIDRINTNALGIDQEIIDRAANDDALGVSINNVQAHSDESRALISEESLTRTTNHDALATQVNTLTADKAEIFYQSSAPVDDPVGTLQVGMYWIDTSAGDAVHRWDGTAWLQVDISTVDQTSAAVQDNNTAMLGYCEVGGVPDTSHTTPTQCAAAGGIWLVASPLAQGVKTVQISDNDGELASVEQRMISYKDNLGGLNSQYTAKVDANGVVGGFGLYNDGSTVEAAFDVDRFWIGETDLETGIATGIKPFIIEGGTTYIDEAAINKLTFSKLRDEAGSLIVANGVVQAAYIDADNLSVAEAATFGGTAQSENFVAGSAGWRLANDPLVTSQINFPLTFGSSTGLKALAGKDTADWASDVVGTGKPADNADVTAGQSLTVLTDLVADNISESAARKWAGEAGADITENNAEKIVFYQATAPTHKIGRVWVDSDNGDMARSTGTSWVNIGSSDALRLTNAPAEAGAEVTAGKSLTLLTDLIADNISEGAARKWAAETGADITGSNTANDTTYVSGRSATTVRDEARDGTNARNVTNDWTRPNTTRIDGNKIYTGDAYVDTLQIKNNAVTIPLFDFRSSETAYAWDESSPSENMNSSPIGNLLFTTDSSMGSQPLNMSVNFSRDFSTFFGTANTDRSQRAQDWKKHSYDEYTVIIQGDSTVHYTPCMVNVRIELWRSGSRVGWAYRTFFGEQTGNVYMEYATTIYGGYNYEVKFLAACTNASNALEQVSCAAVVGQR